ncbi:hypothetical protein BCT82_03650 [Vibrio breoganii]|uniref:glycosyltransferase n=1 Tax=Vibrio breoganii TaxID=553239 RepID=UPI000C82FD74|nr:glycosyltransferase [Vibrio breoganii]PML20709.1 hypothetical protein BCT82_03650 [Vibrio breoganii]
MLAINASNLSKGGAVQVAVWFICKMMKHSSGNVYFLSRQVSEQLEKRLVELKSTNDVYIIEMSPAKSLKTRKFLLRKETELGITKVFTIFGPSYINFKSYHIMGFADGWVTHSTLNSFFQSYRLNLYKIFLHFLSCLYKAYWVVKADRWFVETEVAKKGLSKRLGISLGNISVISNNCSDIFKTAPYPDSSRNVGPFKLLYFTADYDHKLIFKIAELINEMSKYKEDFIFNVTIEKDSPSAVKLIKSLECEAYIKHIKFLGKIDLVDAVEVVDNSDAMIHLSCLETFSATYLEAMYRNKPLIVSDFKFSRDICGNAASYIDVNDAITSSKIILNLMDNPRIQADLIEKGKQRRCYYPVADERFQQYSKYILDRNYNEL